MPKLPPHIRQLAPSLQTRDDSVTINLTDFRNLLQFALANVQVDERWYCSQYPDVTQGPHPNSPESNAEFHFRIHGYLEGRIPCNPDVDEAWYKRMYPDVGSAVDERKLPSAQEHFVASGYAEGRLPNPDGYLAPRIGASRVLPSSDEVVRPVRHREAARLLDKF